MNSNWMHDARPYRGLDTMQVCLNGHLITRAAIQMPDQRERFCKDCGAETILACTECKTLIPGHNWDSEVSSLSPKPPNYCLACGSAYPWQQAAIANAIEVLEELGVKGDDLAVGKTAILELVAASPKTEVSVIRIKRILGKLAKPAYDIGIKVVSDLVSETVKKALLKPGGAPGH